VRTADDALDYLATWCDIVGGELLDGLEWDEVVGPTGSVVVLRVRAFRCALKLARCSPLPSG